MLIQQELRKHGLKYLQESLFLKSTLSKMDSRIILNYDQIKSPKLNKIARQCRGLILNGNDYSLICRSFFRFLNLGESKEDDAKFNWQEEVICSEKADGSLINVYFFEDGWKISTRASFGIGLINDSQFTWEQLVLSRLNTKLLNKELTYTFELCSPYNKVVRIYPETSLFLLAVFRGWEELSFSGVLSESSQIGIPTPETFSLFNTDEVIELVNTKAKQNPQFEGVVLRDIHNNRIKCKSSEYIRLHKLSNNGNISSAKNIIPFIVDGEVDEIILHFPSLQPEVDRLTKMIDNAKKEIDNIWFCYHDTKNQKAFANAVSSSKYSGILFSARKLSVHPLTLLNSEYLIKVLNE